MVETVPQSIAHTGCVHPQPSIHFTMSTHRQIPPAACSGEIAEIIRLLQADTQSRSTTASRNPIPAQRALSRSTTLLQRVMRPPIEHHADLDTALAMYLKRGLHYNCVPQCCNASMVRRQQIQTKAQALRFIGRHMPALLTQISPRHIQDWLQPTSTIIAPAAAEGLSHSSDGTTVHHHAITEALREHPRWVVRDFLLRAVARAVWHSPPKALMSAVHAAIRPGDPPVSRLWQRRALLALQSS